MHKSLIALSLVSLPLWGVNYAWNVDANGNWSVAADWTPGGGPPTTAADTATFPSTAITAPRTVTVDQTTFAVGSLTFSGSIGYSLAGDSLTLGSTSLAQHIILSGSANQLVSCPLLLSSNIVINQGSEGTLTLSGGISGPFGITINESGLVILALNNNTYTGMTTLAANSTLQAAAANAFSASSSSYSVNGTLDLNNNNNSIQDLSGTGTVTTGTGAGGTLTVTNAASTFSGTISGNGGLTITGGSQTLSGTNTYTGTTNISAGTLLLSGTGQLASNNAVVASGIFDIHNISPATSTTIGDLSGNGQVFLGNNTLILGTANSTTFSGVISDGTVGAGGSIQYQGTGTLTLSGNNTYTGTTTINTNGTIRAGIANALSPSSAFTVNGTLNLNGLSNTINSLSGSGTVATGSGGPTFTITNGGIFSGGITGTALLNLTGGTLQLSGTSLNTYSGTTTLSNSAILLAGATSAFSPNSAVSLLGSSELNLSTFSNTIAALSGNSGTFVDIGTGAILTINNGGAYAGTIQGTGALTLAGGTLTLSNDNTYSGGTTINLGSTLAILNPGQISTTAPVVDNGTFDISAGAATTEIGTLSGSGSILLGSNGLIVNETTNSTYSGTIQGSLGSFQKLGTGTLTLSGTSSYTGATTVSAGILQAGAANAFAPASSFTVSSGATIDLNNFNNTILNLNGAGNVTTGTVAGGTLTLANASGVFSGAMSGNGGLTINGGSLTLTGTNTYTGTTNISAGTLQLSGTGQLAPTTAVVDNGIFDIHNISVTSTTIGDLSGNGQVFLGNHTLMLGTANSTTFSGVISGTDGSIQYQGTGTLTLSGNNTYTGTTTINANGTIRAGIANAFSPSSAFIVNGTLSLNGFSNTISSLSGSGTVATGSGGPTFTITDGGIFSGGITGTGLLNLTGGTLQLSGTSLNTYSGTTTLSNSAILLAGATSAFSPNSAVSLLDSSELDLSTFSNTIASLAGDSGTFVDIGTGAILTINNGGAYEGIIRELEH